MIRDLRQDRLTAAALVVLPLIAGFCVWKDWQIPAYRTLYSDMHKAKAELDNCRSVPRADCAAQVLQWQRATWDYTMVDGRGLGKKDFPAKRP